MVSAPGVGTNKINASLLYIKKSTGIIDFVYRFPPFFAYSSVEFSLHQVIVVTPGAFTFTSVAFTFVLGAQKNPLIETVPLSTHNMCFC